MKSLVTRARSLVTAALLGAVAVHMPAAVAAPTLLSHVAGTVVQDSQGFAVDVRQQVSSQASRSFSNAEASEQASAQASLATGTVRVRNETVITNSNSAWGAFATGFFGDGFGHVSGGGPFDWAGQTATFRIAIDGTETLTSPLGDEFNFGIAFLVVYRAGTLDNFLPFCNGDNGGTVYDNVVASFFWSIGGGVNHPCGGSFNGNLSGAVNTTLVASFQPGADFDWIFGVRVGGAINANLPEGQTSSAYWKQDFFNTATLSYQGPEGAEVISRSGVFPGTAAASVPEPGTIVLATLGLALAGSRRTRLRRGSAQ